MQPAGSGASGLKLNVFRRASGTQHRYHAGMANPRWSPSVTAAAIVEHEGRYLLVEEHTPEGLRLNNPAGHLDPGESLLQAVVRETLEETACQFEVQALVGVYMARLQRPGRGADGQRHTNLLTPAPAADRRRSPRRASSRRKRRGSCAGSS